jgi:desulfoferrodoxin (superoxide reductase-like protein)
MVDEIGNLISTLFQRQKSNVNQFAFSILFQRRSNVWMTISNVDSTLNKRHFARWVKLIYYRERIKKYRWHLFLEVEFARVHSVHKSAKISGVSSTNYKTIYS